jgi:hypothetical protein
VVKVGAHFNNFQAVNLETHTYEADFYVWFKWCDPERDPATTLEFLNTNEAWGHMITPAYEEVETLPDGSLYQVLHVTGRFSTKMPLHSYPFDRQVIGPILEDSRDGAAAQRYEADGPTAITLNPDFILPGYVIGEPRLRITNEAYPTSFGDPREGAPQPYSRVYLELPLSRPIFTQVVQLFVPLLSVVVCAALMFVLSPRYVDSRISVGITAMLTIVALQMTYNQDLPDLGYLMMMDKVYLVAYGYVLLGLGVVVAATHLVHLGREQDATRLHRYGLMVASGLFVVCVLTLVGVAAVQG